MKSMRRHVIWLTLVMPSLSALMGWTLSPSSIVHCPSPISLSAPRGGTSQQRPKIWLVEFVHIDPTMVEQYEQAVRDRIAVLKQAKLGKAWAWYATSRPGFTYTFAFPLESIAALEKLDEQAEPMVQAIGQAHAEALMKKEAAAIRTSHRELIRHVEELSYRPVKPAATRPVPGFQRVVVEWVKPGMTKLYQDLIKQRRDALAKSMHPFGYEAYRILIGDGSYAYVWMTDSAEQFHQANRLEDALIQALGPKDANVLSKRWRECLWKFAYYDGQPRPELSYVPAPETN